MSPSRVTTSAIDAYLTLVRRPVDLAIRVLPGRRTGPAAAAKLTVDRFDATVRSVLGAALRDDQLTEDARRRRDAAAEREHAVELRVQAEATEARTEERLEARHEEADHRRERARTTAASRRRQAARTEKTRTQRARQTESERLQASRTEEARADQRIDSQESRERLPAVEEQAQALMEHEAALRQADEAQRVGDAAARVKRERKEG
jgi:hypothetical protein